MKYSSFSYQSTFFHTYFYGLFFLFSAHLLVCWEFIFISLRVASQIIYYFKLYYSAMIILKPEYSNSEPIQITFIFYIIGKPDLSFCYFELNI